MNRPPANDSQNSCHEPELADQMSELLDRDEMAAYREALSRPAPRCIRLRPDRGHSIADSTSLDSVPWHHRGRIVRDPGMRPSQSLCYAAADYYIQDAGSLLALALLDPQPHEAICDLCAAPGGKASGIAESLGERGFLLANEPILSRVAVLRMALSRTGSPRYAVIQQDPEQVAARFAGQFDAVLVDAPCSGQALVARGKRDANAFDAKQIEHSVHRQRRILLAACRLLKQGGRLIYSTCTFSVEENESQIRFLRHQFPDAFEPIAASGLARWASPIEAGCYRLWPHRDSTAGAFVGGLKLKNTIEDWPMPTVPTASVSTVGGRRRNVRSFPSSHRRRVDVREGLDSFGTLNGVRTYLSEGEDAHGISDDVPEEFARSLNARECPKLAVYRSGIWKPEHPLAMLGPEWFAARRQLAITDDQAQKYMLGEAFSWDGGEMNTPSPVGETRVLEGRKSPWAVVVWRQKPLGWAKIVGNRLNNHLPAQAIVAIDTLEEFLP